MIVGRAFVQCSDEANSTVLLGNSQCVSEIPYAPHADMS